MRKAQPKQRHSLAGRIFRALGFRWVFPIGTLALPYHTLLFPIAILALFIWFGWLVVQAQTAASAAHLWLRPIPLFAAIGVLMSVPIVAWAMMVFRAPLIQGLLGLAIPLLAAIEVISGSLPPSFLALPVTYLSFFVFQLWYGPRRLARIKAENAAFQPIDPGQATIALRWRVHQPEFNLAQINAARIWARPLRGKDGWLIHRISLEDADRIEHAAGGKLPSAWRLWRSSDWATLKQACAKPPEDSIFLSKGPCRSFLWSVIGLQEYRARVDGRTHRLRFGEARLVSRIPLFIAFHWTAIFGGKSEWHFGFPRKPGIPVTIDSPSPNIADHALIEPRPSTGGTADTTHIEEIIEHFEGWAEEKRLEAVSYRERQDAFWNELHEFNFLPLHLKPFQKALCAEQGSADPARLKDALDWIERAYDAASMNGLVEAVSLLEAFTDADLAREAERLERIFNSRKIALQWDMATLPHERDLPRATPIYHRSIAGFGLYLARPEFYARLARINRKMADIVEVLEAELDKGAPGLRHDHAMVIRR